MEEDIEKIKTEIENFMKKYNCEVKVEGIAYGTTLDGKVAYAKTRFIINT